MKKIAIVLAAAVMMAGCSSPNERIVERVEKELKYLPDRKMSETGMYCYELVGDSTQAKVVQFIRNVVTEETGKMPAERTYNESGLFVTKVMECTWGSGDDKVMLSLREANDDTGTAIHSFINLCFVK